MARKQRIFDDDDSAQLSPYELQLKPDEVDAMTAGRMRARRPRLRPHEQDFVDRVLNARASKVEGLAPTDAKAAAVAMERGAETARKRREKDLRVQPYSFPER